MMKNTILEDLYAAREKLLASVGGDVHKYLVGLREREAASGRLLKPSKINAHRPDLTPKR